MSTDLSSHAVRKQRGFRTVNQIQVVSVEDVFQNPYLIPPAGKKKTKPKKDALYALLTEKEKKVFINAMCVKFCFILTHNSKRITQKELLTYCQ